MVSEMSRGGNTALMPLFLPHVHARRTAASIHSRITITAGHARGGSASAKPSQRGAHAYLACVLHCLLICARRLAVTRRPLVEAALSLERGLTARSVVAATPHKGSAPHQPHIFIRTPSFRLKLLDPHRSPSHVARGREQRRR